MHALIDGDTFCWRAALSPVANSTWVACKLFDQQLHELRLAAGFDTAEGFLTGTGNFRDTIAVTAGYKENRKKRERPEYLDGVRQYALQEWGFILSEGEEADDAVGIAHTACGEEALIISEDKDLLQLPGRHFIPRKGEFVTISPLEGLRHFYTQVLTGDSTDNVIGIYRMGPVTAGKLLAPCKNALEMYAVCLEAYDGDATRVLENGQLLWIRRTPGELWLPPHAACATTSV